MNKNILRSGLLALVLALFGAGSALAEDIDIYSQNTSVQPGVPNVLIVLDNTANWSQSFAGSTKFAAEMTALAAVVNSLKTQFRLGVMFSTETGSPNAGPDGGYVRFAIQDMTDSSGNATDARNCLLKMVGAGTSCNSTNPAYSVFQIGSNPGDKSNGGKAGITMGEVYDYFAGTNAYAGHNKVKADPLAFLSNSIAGPRYKSPVTEACQKNFVIVINNGQYSDNSSDTSTATGQLAAVNGDTAVINPPDNGSSNNNEADEWVRYLRKAS
jgi:type IV pilus assembly protein PilY1